MKMFKVRLRFGNVLLEVSNKQQWNLLMNVLGKLTLDQALEKIYTGEYTQMIKQAVA